VKDYGWKGRVFAISAISGVGCKELTYAIMDHLDEVKKAKIELENEPVIITE
jgi:GTPase